MQQQGDNLMNKAVGTADDSTRAQIIDSHNQLVDGLVAKGAVTAVQAVTMKQGWAHQYATADLLARSETDPQGVINELQAAPGSPDAVVSRIIQNESSNNPNAKARGSSASGLGGFTDDTWLGLIKQQHPELAQGRSDQDLLALKADPNLSREMTGALVKQNSAALQGQGLPATPGNVYLAHFLGPTGAAAVLKADPNQPVQDALTAAVGKDKAAAMIAANPSVLAGKLAGSVTQWSDGKMGGQQPGAGSVYDMIRPDVRQQILEHAQTVLAKQNVEDTAGFKQRIEDSQAEAFGSGNVVTPIPQSDFIRTLGADAGPKAFATYQQNVQLGRDINKVATLGPDEQQALLKSYEPQPGPGYSDAAKREDAIGKEIARVQQLRVKDPDFRQRIGDTTQEAMNTGKVAKPITADEFNYHFGTDDGPKAYAQYTASMRLGRDVNGVADLSPQEQTAMLGGYDPTLQGLMYGAGTEDATKRQSAIGKAIDQVNKEKDDDPAAFAIQRLPATGGAYKDFSDAVGNPLSTPDAKAAAARTYANTTLLEQSRVGIAPADQKIVPQAYADHLSTALSNAATSDDPQARVGLIARVQQEASMWGNAWPQVMAQLAPQSQPIVRAIAAGADPTAMTRLLSLDPKEKPADVLKQQDVTKAAQLNTSIDDAMAPFRSSLVGRQLDRDYPGYYKMASDLGALYVRDGMSANDAASKAFNDLVGARYDFRDTWRMPKSSSVSADDVQAGTLAARSQLGVLGAKPPIADVPGADPQADLADIGRNGKWVTSPDNAGLNLANGDKFVRGADGMPLKLSWQQLSELGKQRRADVKSARPRRRRL